MKPGTTADASASELAGLLSRIEGQFADATPARLAELGLEPVVVPLRDDITRPVVTTLWALVGGMAFLWLAACTNVATLFVTRAAGRTREVAIRQALGAGRVAVGRTAMAESIVVAGAGVLLGSLRSGLAQSEGAEVTDWALPDGRIV
jgi:hypothetical protein